MVEGIEVDDDQAVIVTYASGVAAVIEAPLVHDDDHELFVADVVCCLGFLR